MTRQDFLDKIDELSPSVIAEGIISGIVTFPELRDTERFDHSVQKAVRKILNDRDDDVFNSANSFSALEDYILRFPDGRNSDQAKEKLYQLKTEKEEEEKKRQNSEKILREIRANINGKTVGEIKDLLSKDDFNTICYDIGLDPEIVKGYKSPTLRFNIIPTSEDEVPAGYTDVFLWGIPSSGKTCALAAIFNTIRTEYTMAAPDINKMFGTTYRASLVNMFDRNIGYLPEGGTVRDRTQYMPFLLYNRGESKKRKISFFELSGEVFKMFYDKVHGTQILDGEAKRDIDKSFKTVELLLRSNNQKIHFFLIDYNIETNRSKDKDGNTQYDYLEAAKIYFEQNNKILSHKTDAIYIIITKADEIAEENRVLKASEFLKEHFGDFYDLLKKQSKKHGFELKVKVFSIGDVYFKRICKIDRSYSKDIIEDLMQRIKPVGNGNWGLKILNK